MVCNPITAIDLQWTACSALCLQPPAKTICCTFHIFDRGQSKKAAGWSQRVNSGTPGWGCWLISNTECFSTSLTCWRYILLQENIKYHKMNCHNMGPLTSLTIDLLFFMSVDHVVGHENSDQIFLYIDCFSNNNKKSFGCGELTVLPPQSER